MTENSHQADPECSVKGECKDTERTLGHGQCIAADRMRNAVVYAHGVAHTYRVAE